MSSDNLQVKEVALASFLGDVGDPSSFHNLLPACIVSGAMIVEQKHLDMTDKDIKNMMPTTLALCLSRLRESLWFHIHGARGGNRKVNLNAMVFGIMTVAHFANQMKRPECVAFILRPPGNYEIFMKEALNFAVDQIRDILEQDHMNPKTGLLDAKIADVKRRIFVDIADRVKGMPVQRTENLNVNKELGPKQSFESSMPVSAADIDKKIADLEKDMGVTRDVTGDEK